MSRSLPPDRTGQVVGGRYEILSLLGEGGQSSVYRARDRREGDEVALKILKPGTDKESTERMFREARALASLHGTATVRVLDQEWTDDGAMSLVTELLIGEPLDDALEKIEASGKRVELDYIARLLEPVVETLHAAHAIGIVHRDLKPANIFVLSEDRGVRLIDFGFAKFQRLRGLTAHDFIAGSPSYIAPETWMGRQDAIDHRIDVYGFGAVIFRCFAGAPPFVSKDIAVLLREASTAPRPSLFAKRPDLGEMIDHWVDLALAIDPDARFHAIRALWRAFLSAARSGPG
ncbi:MAG TPA: serine/threonine-protein kinase [Polyangiaceae bacterium]|jgi:serine/threonine-protein kinase|nr:serine/threonine-protein kinase [Polyangiaceae bacterium]